MRNGAGPGIVLAVLFSMASACGRPGAQLEVEGGRTVVAEPDADGKSATAEAVVCNRGSARCDVFKIDSSCRCQSVEPESFSLEPGASVRLRIQLRTHPNSSSDVFLLLLSREVEGGVFAMEVHSPALTPFQLDVTPAHLVLEPVEGSGYSCNFVVSALTDRAEIPRFTLEAPEPMTLRRIGALIVSRNQLGTGHRVSQAIRALVPGGPAFAVPIRIQVSLEGQTVLSRKVPWKTRGSEHLQALELVRDAGGSWSRCRLLGVDSLPEMASVSWAGPPGSAPRTTLVEAGSFSAEGNDVFLERLPPPAGGLAGMARGVLTLGLAGGRERRFAVLLCAAPTGVLTK